MTPNPRIIQAIQKLNYRVTVGDVAATIGWEIERTQQGLLALASDARGHLQVTDTGDIVYLFPKNFRTLLRNKFWRLRFQEWWNKVWQIVFYIIRISFGIVLIASILLMVVAIIVIIIAMSSKDGDSDSGNNSGDGGGFNWVFPARGNPFDIFWLLQPDYNYYQHQTKQGERNRSKFNLLEAIFSFLFGDGNPNFNLEELRWESIGKAIRHNQGAIIAEQIAPYLDEIDKTNSESEDYILPVLARFNGYPEVSPQGEIVYYFPELQVSAKTEKQERIKDYLVEKSWHFSQADSGQIVIAIGLGTVNLVLAIVLGFLLAGSNLQQSIGFIALVSSIYGLLLFYALGFLGIPLIRYFWVRWQNSKIQKRNRVRQERSSLLTDGLQGIFKQKFNYARQFAKQKIIGREDIEYSTQKDLIAQEIEGTDPFQLPD